MILVYLYAACQHSGPFPVADMSKEGNSFDRVNSARFREICVYYFEQFLKLWKWMQDLSTGWLRCDPDPLFKPEHYPLPGWVPQWVSQLSTNFYTKNYADSL